jgi:hypothetical protein
MNTKYLKLEACIDSEKSSKTSVTIDVKEDNPFVWMMVPRNSSFSSGVFKKIFRTLTPINGFRFPKEIPENFWDFLINPKGTLTFHVKAELQWRLEQVSGAIWENDGLGNVLRLLEQSKIPSWENGRHALERLSEDKRADIKKNDANKMSAILLYEFATGRTQNHTDFSETDAFARELNKGGSLLKEVIRKFYEDMETLGIKNEYDFLQKWDHQYRTEFAFSPDHTDSIKESWQKHIDAWNNNPTVFIIGGMSATITQAGNLFFIRFTNRMGLKSLALHMMDNYEGIGPLKTQTQTFTFRLPLEQFQKYKP